MKAGRVSRWRPGAFGVALIASIVLHVLLLLGPAWQVPVTVEPVKIEATLRLPPARTATVMPQKPPEPAPKAVAKATAKTPRPGPARRVLASPQKQAEAPTVAALPATSESDVSPPASATGSAPVASVPEAKPAPEPPKENPLPVTVDPAATEAWPHQGRIVFQVRYGETLDVARMVHTWSHDGERYTMRAELETVGLARMFRKFVGVQQSQGWVGPEGLAPTGFQEDLNGKQSHAIFDWTTRRVTMSRPDRVREEPITGQAQDILSLVHHLAFQPDNMAKISVFVVAGRWGAEAELTQVASERLRLPWGLVDTRHFHCEARNGEFGIDVWLSREHRNAPVRIRVDDRKQGHVVDEVALEMELDGVKTEFRQTEEEKDMYKG